MEIEKMHELALHYISRKIKELNYPQDHPFLQYPQTPNGMVLEQIIILKIFLNNDNTVDDLLKKCKSTENGVFSQERFNQNISEVIVLYYIIIGIVEQDRPNNFKTVLYEPDNIIENDKKLEYSLLFDNNQNGDLINFEVKTLTCDPFMKEADLRVMDGKQLVKPFFPDDYIVDKIKKEYPNSVLLENSTYYRQIKKNINKIIEKYDGNNLTSYQLGLV